MSGKARVTYWAGRGRCEPLRMILAAGGVLMEHNVLTAVDGAQALRALRESGKLAYDQVPLVEIDGLNLVQGTPTAQYIAQRCALWPSTPESQYRAGAVFAAAQDARAPLVSYPFHGDLNRLLADLSSPRGLWGRYAVKWEAMLAEQKFLAGDAPSLADVAVYEVLDFAHAACAASGSGTCLPSAPSPAFDQSLAAFPRLRALRAAVHELGRLKQWIEVERPEVFESDWAAYRRSVDMTLSR